MGNIKLYQGDFDSEIKHLYVDERYTLRRIANKYNTDHHTIKRHLIGMGISITQKNRVREPFSDEHRRRISEGCKGRTAWCAGKKMPYVTVLKNMVNHIQWDVDLNFYLQFPDVEKLKCLNRLVSRDRVSCHFDSAKYKAFITKFYYDGRFNLQHELYMKSKSIWDKPSLDHILPLSKGGSWDLDNLQIISWFENRAKCDMDQNEFNQMIQKYFVRCEQIPNSNTNRTQRKKPQESKSKKLF